MVTPENASCPSVAAPVARKCVLRAVVMLRPSQGRERVAESVLSFNLLLAVALRRVGYDVDAVTARRFDVFLQKPPATCRSRDHADMPSP